MKRTLDSIIRDEILYNGYVTLDYFLYLASEHYYQFCNSIGEHGDFITATSSTQLFGETIAIWCVKKWLDSGSRTLNLIELGPGDGYLMQDLLRSTSHVPGFHESIRQVLLVENSELLADKQRLRLKGYQNLSIKWMKELRLADLNSTQGNFTILIANEFFDALPIKQFVYDGQSRFSEVVVTLKGDKLSLARLAPSVLENFGRINKFKEGAVFEYSPTALLYAEEISAVLKSARGSGLIIDYGYTNSPGLSTIQSLKGHSKNDFLCNVGESDITSLVNFQALQSVFRKSSFICNLDTQRNFLIQHGILERLEYLLKNPKFSLEQKKQFKKHAELLIARDKMGDHFKVLEVNVANN